MLARVRPRDEGPSECTRFYVTSTNSTEILCIKQKEDTLRIGRDALLD